MKRLFGIFTVILFSLVLLGTMAWLMAIELNVADNIMLSEMYTTTALVKRLITFSMAVVVSKGLEITP